MWGKRKLWHNNVHWVVSWSKFQVKLITGTVKYELILTLIIHQTISLILNSLTKILISKPINSASISELLRDRNISVVSESLWGKTKPIHLETWYYCVPTAFVHLSLFNDSDIIIHRGNFKLHHTPSLS